GTGRAVPARQASDGRWHCRHRDPGRAGCDACRARLAPAAGPHSTPRRHHDRAGAGGLMSFILDALKKSEAERQRQSGPTLLELRMTQPRRRYPVWAVWVGVLLALNVAVLLYALLRRPAAP